MAVAIPLHPFSGTQRAIHIYILEYDIFIAYALEYTVYKLFLIGIDAAFSFEFSGKLRFALKFNS